jgi:hypothetical protein
LKLITALKRLTIAAGIGTALWEIYNSLHGRPDQLQYSKSQALKKLLDDSGYVGTHYSRRGQ